MLQRRKKSMFSTGRQKMKDVSEAFQQNLLRDIKLDFPFREHQMTIEQLVDIYPLSRINCVQPINSVGLNDDEAEIKLSNATEKNFICPKNRKGGKIQAFLHQFNNTFRILLLIATICCFLIFALDRSHHKELVMGIILFTVLIIMCMISYYEELNTITQISSFQSMIAIDSTVIRCGRKIIVPAENLIVGDLVWIQTGDRIPADMRLIYSDDLQVETSWLSGEVEPLPYTDEPVADDVGVFESQNIVFNGCSVTSGKGLGLVIRIGNSTVLGNLVEITSKEKAHKSPLQIEHNRFVYFITVSAVIVAAITFFLGLILTNFSHVLSTFVNGFLIVLVAWVPQGLPVTLTAQLLIVARRLAKFGMYLKRLECADTLGITSILMVDKTGCLTADDLRVTDLWTLESSTTAAEVIENHQKSVQAGEDQTRSRYHLSDNNCNIISGVDDLYGILITIMSVCDKAIIENSHHSTKINPLRKTPSFRRRNFLSLDAGNLKDAADAKAKPSFSLQHKDLKEKSIIGKSVDVALVKFVENLTSVEKIRDDYEIIFEVPFSSQRRLHLVIVCSKSSKRSSSSATSSYSEMTKYTVMVKGAPEEVIMSCSTIVTQNGEERIDDDKLVEFEKSFLQYCNEGKSCLGFAMREFEDFSDTHFYYDPMAGSNFPDEEWCFLGMTALYDPPLPGVAEAVMAADKADIRVFMISGDHPVTAEALARQMRFDFGDANIAAADASIASIASGIVGEGVDVEKVSSHKSSIASSVSTNSIRIDPIANLEVIRGEMVKELSQADWARLLSRKRIVFARTTPIQKMNIVKSCQLTDFHQVTVTGDGVMAAPALKQADCGLAMEAVGSIFAKEAADIVVTQPQLPNLIAAVAEARLLFDNLKKTIAYSLSHLLPEVIPVWFTFVLGFPLGLNSLQILTIDLLSEIPPSIALVFEPAERDLMRRAPRKKKSLLVTKAMLAYSYCFAGMFISIGCVLAYFTVFWANNITLSDLVNSDTVYWSPISPNLTLASGIVISPDDQSKIYQQASAAWHLTLVGSQGFHLFMCTTRRISIFKHGIRNWTLLAAVCFEILTVFFVIFVPGVQDLLQVRPPAWYIWLFPFAVGIVLLVFNETRKYFIRNYPKDSVVRIFKW